jgi:tRNA A37 methylthiotransferase MiaB
MHRRWPSAPRWSAACSACWSSAAPRKGHGELAGRTENNRWVNFPGRRSLLQQFVDVEITEARPHSLRGARREPEAA